MTSKSKVFLQNSRCSGLTLVEVLAATVLSATILVSMLAMFNSHQRQLVRSHQLRLGVEAMESILTTWYSERDRLPKSDALPVMGNCPFHSDFFWHAGVIQSGSVSSIPDAFIVRVSIFDRIDPEQPVTFCDLLYSDD